MATNAVIGALRVILGGDTSSLESSLKTAAVKVGIFAGVSIAAGQAIGESLGGAIRSVANAIPATINAMDNMAKQSQKIGIPVEQLSAFKLAADLSDVSMEQLGKGVGKLSKTMVEAAAKPTSEAANAFRALGLTATDAGGKLKMPADMVVEIAGKFEGMKDGAGKTAAAMALLGKSGADLIPLLNSGSAGLAEMVMEARQLGLVISTETAKSAEAFNDNLTRLGAVKDGIIIQLSAHMLPLLQALSQTLIDAAKNSKLVETVSGALKTTFEVLARAVILVADNIGVLARIAAVFIGVQVGVAVISMGLAFAKLAYAVYTTGIAMTLFNGIRSLSMKGILVMAGIVALAAGAFDGFTDKIKSIGAAVQNMLPEGSAAGDFIEMLGGLGVNIRGLTVDLEKLGAAAPKGTKGLKDISTAALGGKNAFDQFIASQQKSLITQEADFAATGMAAGAKERLRIVNQGLAVAQQAGIALTEAQRLKLTETAAAAELMALKLGNLSLLGGESNPFIAIGVALDATKLKMQEAGLEAGDYATLSGQAAGLTSKLWADSATSLGGSFESIGSSLSQMGEGWARFAKVGQAIGAAIAFVNAYVAASEAFAKTPFPANIAVAAGVLAKGIGMVAAIKGAVAPSGHAMGGAFRVPGGIGGGDRVPYNMLLEPGELLEITSNRPDGYKAGGRGGSPQSGGTYTLQVPDFLRSFAEAIMPHIEAANRDGHQLKLATA